MLAVRAAARGLTLWLPALTPARAIVVAAAFIAAAVLAGLLLAPRMAPYRLVASGGSGFWWVNIVTGEVQLCTGILPPKGRCYSARRPDNAGPLPTSDEFFGPKPSRTLDEILGPKR
jgi:hypothetical protein